MTRRPGLLACLLWFAAVSVPAATTGVGAPAWQSGVPAPAGPSAGAPPAQTPTISSVDASGHRLWIMLFDITSMQSDDVTRARNSALRWINTSMNHDDLVSVLTVGSAMALVQNFTTDVDRVRHAVDGISAAPEFGTAAPGEADLLERDQFNNDLRYHALRTLCSSLRSVGQRKSILFFTATRERPGADNQIEVRGATDACNQANATVNPVDVRDSRGGGLSR